MKFICSKSDLIEATTTVQKAVMAKATLPMLEGIYIEATHVNLLETVSIWELNVQ